ncbi:MAG: Nudix family hydrolase [Betaproteobacteria bacterium]|nr:Nudix family hydrolase [Betaproteobacteria bacterium]
MRPIEVAAAVLIDASGRFLLAQRPPGKVYAGYWEFPGGKVESGETPRQALDRELVEELGIAVRTAYPWITLSFRYPHAFVRLRFFRVLAWAGELHPHEGQAVAWQRVDRVDVAPVLPANGPVLRALALPHVYGISRVAQLGPSNFRTRLDAALARGLRLVQLREKDLDEDVLIAVGREVTRRCHAAGAKVLVNGEVGVADAIGADGVHLSAARLKALGQRPDAKLCAASCHDRAELDRAAELGVDFVVLGPVHPTPTHEGMATLGWERFADLIADYPLPVFALGGMGPDDLAAAWTRSAHGISMMRGAWSGDRPA